MQAYIPFCLTSNKRRGFSILLNFSQLIHRDLAARNVLLGDKLQCKITDFGMARDLGLGDGIYARKSNVSSGRRDITRSNKNLLLYLFIYLFIRLFTYNGNRTGWSLIRSVIIRVINKIGRARRGTLICLTTSMITDLIGWHEVLLPIDHNRYNFRENKCILF